MSRKRQLKAIKDTRNSFIEDLESFYKKAFAKLVTLRLNEKDISKLTQILLQSKDMNISNDIKKIEAGLYYL